MSKKVMSKKRSPKAEINMTAKATATIKTDHALTVIDQYQDVKAHSCKIKGSWQKAVNSIIETGQFLIEAKKDLPHGKFLKLFDPEIGDLPFGKDTAQLLMKIAKNKVLSKADYSRFLPPYWRTLVILSRATDEQLEGWISDETVHPELQQLEAVALVNPTMLPAPITVPFGSEKHHSYLAGLTGVKMAQEYTKLIQQRQLYEGACELPWVQYFEYRDKHQKKYPLTNDDLAYVRMWTLAGPAPTHPEAEQLKLELDDEIAERLKGSEKAVKKLDRDVTVQQLQNLYKTLFDPNIEWDNVIDVAGESLVHDLINELSDILDKYKKQTAVKSAADRAEDRARKSVH